MQKAKGISQKLLPDCYKYKNGIIRFMYIYVYACHWKESETADDCRLWAIVLIIYALQL